MESAKAWWVEVGVYVGSTGNVSLKVAPIMEKNQLEILMISYLRHKG